MDFCFIRFLIEKTLSAVLNEKENGKRIQILTSYIEENQTQNSLKESEMKYKESLLDHTKSNEKDGKNKILSLKESDQNLKEEISLLKVSAVRITLLMTKFLVSFQFVPLRIPLISLLKFQIKSLKNAKKMRDILLSVSTESFVESLSNQKKKSIP